MDIIFSDGAKNLINQSKNNAESFGTPVLMPEHMLLSMILIRKSCAYKILSSGLSISTLEMIKEEIEHDLKNKVYQNGSKIFDDEKERIKLNQDFVLLLKEAKAEAIVNNDKMVGSIHLLLSLLKNENLNATNLLTQTGITYHTIKSQFLDIEISNIYNNFSNNNHFEDQNSFIEESNLETNTPLLNSYARNLNKLAIENKLDMVVGRELEIQRTSQILSRRKKNNVLLIGNPGVGKTAIAEGIVLNIVKNKVNSSLIGKTIFGLDVASLVAGTKYRGQFEERIKEIIEEVINAKNVILFIDEIHTIMGAGGVGGGALDASNILKPVLTDGRIQCIGATTTEEYKKYIKKDGAFSRRFQNIFVEQPTPNDTLKILKNIKVKYEKFHNVKYTDKAIESCVNLSNQYITDRFFPDKAIDVLDEAGAAINIKNSVDTKEINDLKERLNKLRIKKNQFINTQDYELAASYRDREQKLEQELFITKNKWNKTKNKKQYIIEEEDIIQIISLLCRVPISKMSKNFRQHLNSIYKNLLKKIIGQDEQVFQVVKTLQRSKIGLKDPNKPLGSFIFMGPTGVGKTYLAEEIALQFFGKKEALIRVDMSEYMEKFSVSGLIGAPPGYVGHDEGGKLTEMVYKNPYSVVLLDEIEKAHPDIQNILLQVFDNGFLTDSLNRKVDFRNTVIIMTSNLGVRKSQEFNNYIGFNNDVINDTNLRKDIINKELLKYFNPEFLGRISEVIFFNYLSKQNIKKIADIEIGKLNTKIKKIGYFLNLDSNSKKFIIEQGHSVKYGTRLLQKTIERYIEDPITNFLVKNSLKTGSEISFKFSNKEQKPIIIK